MHQCPGYAIFRVQPSADTPILSSDATGVLPRCRQQLQAKVQIICDLLPPRLASLTDLPPADPANPLCRSMTPVTLMTSPSPWLTFGTRSKSRSRFVLHIRSSDIDLVLRCKDRLHTRRCLLLTKLHRDLCSQQGVLVLASSSPITRRYLRQ